MGWVVYWGGGGGAGWLARGVGRHVGGEAARPASCKVARRVLGWAGERGAPTSMEHASARRAPGACACPAHLQHRGLYFCDGQEVVHVVGVEVGHAWQRGRIREGRKGS